jgi:hypothetical protein
MRNATPSLIPPAAKLGQAIDMRNATPSFIPPAAEPGEFLLRNAKNQKAKKKKKKEIAI